VSLAGFPFLESVLTELFVVCRFPVAVQVFPFVLSACFAFDSRPFGACNKDTSEWLCEVFDSCFLFSLVFTVSSCFAVSLHFESLPRWPTCPSFCTLIVGSVCNDYGGCGTTASHTRGFVGEASRYVHCGAVARHSGGFVGEASQVQALAMQQIAGKALLRNAFGCVEVVMS